MLNELELFDLTELFEMELFLTLKLYLHWTELLYIELFWHLTCV